MPASPISDGTLWVLTTLAGVVGLFLALRGLFGDSAGGKPKCWKCRYDLTGVDNLTCPECGHVHKHRARLLKTRRYFKRFVAGTGLLLMALYCHTGPDVQYRRGTLKEAWWQSVIPTTAWNWMLPYLEAEQLQLLDYRLLGRTKEAISFYMARGGLTQDGGTWMGGDRCEVRAAMPIESLWGWQRALLLSRCRVVLETPVPAVGIVRDPVVNPAMHHFSARREHAAYWVGGLAMTGDEGAKATLVDVLRGPRARDEKFVAADVAKEMKLSTPAMREALIDLVSSDPDEMTRAFALEALEVFPDADPVIISLLSCANNDESGDDRFWAEQTLASQRVTPDVIAAARVQWLQPRMTDYEYPPYIIELGEAVIPVLIDDLIRLMTMRRSAVDERVLEWISGGLSEFGPKAAPHLLKLLRHPERAVRERAVRIIRHMEGHAPATMIAGLHKVFAETKDAADKKELSRLIDDIEKDNLPGEAEEQ